MNFFTYLLHLPPYVGLTLVVFLSFVSVVALVSIPLGLIYWFDNGVYPDAETPIDNSTDGGAGACAVVCVSGI